MLWIKWKKIDLKWRLDKKFLVFININIRFGYKRVNKMIFNGIYFDWFFWRYSCLRIGIVVLK